MKLKAYSFLTFFLVNFIITNGCAKRNSEVPATLPALSVTTDKLDFFEMAGTQNIIVQTNAGAYTVTIPVSWCTYKITGNSLEITVKQMAPADPDRTTIVEVTAGSGNNKIQKQIQISQKRNTWTLIFEDNFDTDGPVNAAKWNLQGSGSSDWNRYLTLSNEMAFVQDGNLILKATKDATGYHTSAINSSNKFNFTYGKVEVRAKLPAGQGTWPAIWMMPQTSFYGGWPKSGEIDIMEHLNNDAIVYNVIHSNWVDNLGQKTKPVYVATPSFNVGAYNTFGIEWYPDKIDFFVNGAKTLTYSKRADVAADQLQWPFDKPFYLILNTASGGSWAGAINDAILPVQTEIDYVKVYNR